MGFKHYLHSEKSIVEKVNQYFKARIVNFNYYYQCTGKSNCDLKHTYKWISFFILMYNDIKNHRFKIEFGGEEIILT
ncbi:MAG: hypothetical protein DA329_12450 [Candidatus Nitrosocosmicus sp.]|nr:hypothetical protein [Candidatus Nitrosocosmicus sp.]